MVLEVRQIRLVEALVEHGNFARAAKALSMTQPGLSKAIQNLEQNLGVRLFDRNNREVTPTVYGQHILRFGSNMLRDLAALERDLLLLKGNESGELIIGTGPVPAETFLGTALGKLATRHPRLHIRVIVERPPFLFSMLHQRKIDVMIADTRGIDITEDLDITPLPQQPICFIARPEHPLAGYESIPFARIFDFPLAVPWLPQSIITMLARGLGREPSTIGLFPNGMIECNNFKLLSDVVRCSNAIGCGLEVIFAQVLEAGKAVLLPVESGGLSSQYQMVCLKRYSLSPALEIFRTLLLETVKSRPTNS